MAPKKRTMRLNPETTPAATAATTTTITNAQLQTMINQGVTAALAARDANMNGWNSHVRTGGNDITYAMTWAELKKKMTDKYCPRTEIKKLEVELMFPEESDKIEKYVGGLPDMIHRSVVASKPKTMQDTTEMATKMMDKRIRTFADRQTENKRKQDDNQHQQQNKRQNTSRAYTAGTGERKEYAGTLPLCNRCKLHHNGPCTIKCGICKKIGHMTRDCRNPAAARNQRTLTCYECGNPGHYRSDCPELKNQNHGNQAEGTGARGLVHALGGGEADQDLNDMEDDISA
ncbi:RNA-directed DNA polymerase, eukaryota [Tanacetum coccineum]